MNKSRIYNLEERTYVFAKNCRLLIRKLNTTVSNIEDGKQLIRSSGSVGANYIEANEKLSDRDFNYRIKISLKEAKESEYWLKLLKDLNPGNETFEKLIQEADELRRIFSSILSRKQS